MVYTVLLILGLAFGSFINALVWRMHMNARQSKKTKLGRLSVMRGRSMCTHCKATLTAKDLIPIYSWVALRGKCRYCKKKIEDTPLSEVLLPVLLVISYMFWPYGFELAGMALFILWAISLVVLTALFVYDLRWMLLPNKLVFVFIGLAAATILMRTVQEGELTLVLNALLGLASVGGVFYVLHRISRGAWIGFGDVKLGYGIGLLVGAPLLGFLTIFIASILGSIIAIPQLIQRKVTTRSRIPFGPLLITATVIVFLFSEQILQGYLNLFVYQI